jgi:hydroxymethylpyrimidine pyrophosphatase-like HAD family hydrolase
MNIKSLVQTVLILAVLLSANCKTSKTYTKDNLPVKQLSFGTYNVLSGVKVNWIFLENGQVFYQNNLFMVEQKQLEKEFVKELFSEATKIEKSNYKIFLDGSYLAFINFNTGVPGKSASWQWPYGGTKDYPDELSKLYRLCEDATRISALSVTP